MTDTNRNPTPAEKDAALARVHEARKALGRALPLGVDKEPTDEEKKRFEAARAELEAATKAMQALGVEEDQGGMTRDEFLKRLAGGKPN